MSRPKKMAMEGMAGVLRTAIKPGGELEKLMEALPENEHSHFQAAVWGFIRNMDSRAERLPSQPIGKPNPAIEPADKPESDGE